MLILIPLIGATALPFKFGPSVKWFITGSQIYSCCEDYESSLSRMLYAGDALLMIGAMVETELTDDLTIEVSGYYSGYDPAYVMTPPDTACTSIDRSGYMCAFSLGVRKGLGKMFVNAGVEAHYSRESWADPYNGDNSTIDSLSVGPMVGIGTLMDLTPFLIRFDMGLVFPEFSDIWGKIGLSLLI